MQRHQVVLHQHEHCKTNLVILDTPHTFCKRRTF